MEQMKNVVFLRDWKLGAGHGSAVLNFTGLDSIVQIDPLGNVNLGLDKTALGELVGTKGLEKAIEVAASNPATRAALLKAGLKVSGKLIAKTAAKVVVFADVFEAGLALKNGWDTYKACVDHYSHP
jgi:hypothetical protein